jgi:hypothetical protein
MNIDNNVHSIGKGKYQLSVIDLIPMIRKIIAVKVKCVLFVGNT